MANEQKTEHPFFAESDLALERHRILAPPRGTTHEAWQEDCVTVERVRVSTEEGAAALGRPTGTYLTLAFPSPPLLLAADRESIKRVLSSSLLSLYPTPPARLLVVGLGNRRLTADSIGPLAADRVTASAVLEGFVDRALTGTLTAVFTPDVYAQTGLESTEMVRAAARVFAADAVLVIDALAASAKERLLSAVELCDSGTVPGGGVGNRRLPLTREALGVPTVAIGVPTLMRSAALVRHVLTACDAQKEQVRHAAHLAAGLYALPPYADEGIPLLAALLGDSINRAFTGADTINI